MTASDYVWVVSIDISNWEPGPFVFRSLVKAIAFIEDAKIKKRLQKAASLSADIEYIELTYMSDPDLFDAGESITIKKELIH